MIWKSAQGVGDIIDNICARFPFTKVLDRYDDALEQYVIALASDPDSPDVNYNAGLLYFELEEYEMARKHAEKAYDSGYPLPALRNKLIAAGAWKDSQSPKTETGHDLLETGR